MISLARTSLALATAAASLTLVSCEEAGLPITQSVEGAEFSYTIPAGTESEASYTLERTVPVKDIQAQLTALGIDNFVLESVEVKNVDLELVNADGVDASSEAYVAFSKVKSVELSFDEVKSNNQVIAAAVRLATLAPGNYSLTDLTTSLSVVTGINILKFLEQEEVTVRTQVELTEPIKLTQPLTVNVELDYEIKAKVEAGE